MTRESFDHRALRLGEYIVENNATVRAAAKAFGISKSTVHTEVTESGGFGGGCAEQQDQVVRN